MGLPTSLRHRRRGESASSTPWRECDLVALDLETTGLDLAHDHIVSIGYVRIQRGLVITRTAEHLLVNPGCPVPQASARIHNLRTQDLRDAPSLGEIAPRVTSDIGSRPLVAHAAWVERSFLSRENPDLARTLRLRHMVDTAALARALGLCEPGAREPSLEALARELRVPVHTPHQALGDAVTTAQVLLVLASRLQAGQSRPLTLGQLCDLSHRHRARR